MTPEGKVKNDCQKWVKEQRALGVAIYAFKIAGGPRQRVGENDFIVCYRRITVIVELKAPGEDYTKLQKHRANQWAEAGAITGCAHSLGEFIDVVRMVDQISQFGTGMKL